LTVREGVAHRRGIRRGTVGQNSLIVPDEPMNWISDFVTLFHFSFQTHTHVSTRAQFTAAAGDCVAVDPAMLCIAVDV